LFGGSDFIARLWPALVGSMIVWVPGLFKDKLGRGTALLIALGFAIDPSLVAVSRIAASPMPAMVFLLLAFGAFHTKRTPQVLLFLTLGLLSGPAFWMGALLLGISVPQAAWLGAFDLREYVGQRWEAIKEESGKIETYLLPGIVFVILASFLFSELSGLTAWMDSLPTFFTFWFRSGGVNPLQTLIYLIVSNPFIFLFGCLGFISSWRIGNKFGQIASVWTGMALIPSLALSGRGAIDLIWIVVPLWIGAVIEMVRIYRLVENIWAEYVLAGLTGVLITLNWLTLIGMIYQVRDQRSILLQLGLFGASLALIILAFIIISSEWDRRVAQKGLAFGVAVMLLLSTLASLAQGAYLRMGDPRSIWSSRTGAGQYDLLVDSIYDASISQSGRGKVIRGVSLVDRSALRWSLREYEGIEFQTTYDQDNPPPIIITSDLDYFQIDQDMYRGQDFVAETTPGWEGLLPPDWISWIAFRSGQITNQVIILWIRNDINSGY
jgi:hypothetical protein